jgi:NAD(P)-dependent dehydrogenase (short-subunit alcohol dehydrogenase family)
MPDAKPCSAHDVSGLSSRTVVITGGNSGVCYEAALVLAARHDNVVIACRSLDSASAAASAIAGAHPVAAVEVYGTGSRHRTPRRVLEEAMSFTKLRRGRKTAGVNGELAAP